MSDNDWLNTMDGLPPAGTECMVLNPQLDNAQWEKCKILYMGNFVCVYESESCKERVGNHDLYALEFHPIKTERERAIEAALKVVSHKNDNHDCVAALWDAGLLKLPDDLDIRIYYRFRI